MRVAGIVVALAVAVHGALWFVSRHETTAPDIAGPLSSVSYAPYRGSLAPDKGNRSTPAQIRADLKVIAPLTRAIRTYSSTNGGELVPEIASEFGLKVMAGAWIDKDERRNEREMRSAIDLAKRNRNVNGLVIGNETIFRGEKSVDELIKLIHKAKRETQVPVTTGEIWNVWIEHPELATAVDFIAAHILPYWEGFSETQAVDQAVIIYNKLRQAFPGKRIVIAEFGWPSGGYNMKAANPGRLEQAVVLRDFVARADAIGMDYNLIEATDQPWKIFEGSVGPYWGMFDNARQAKFAWTGPIVDPEYWRVAGLALLVGFLLSLPILALAGATASQAALLSMAAHVAGAWFATIFAYWNGHYFTAGAAFAIISGVLLLIPLVFIALARVSEIAAVAFGCKARRLLAVGPSAGDMPATGQSAAGYAPKVSIHIPAYREPPEMLAQTLDAVARLEYPNWECVVVINNTPDPAFWRPIEDHCAALGDRFKFINAEKIEGYKAGALRLALERTADDAEIIGIIDADYTVHADWLRDLVPAFADPRVGLVQAPQDHRDGRRSVMHDAMNGEYAGFFDIGMVERNETNAIVVHGTMCLMRRAALEAAGNWPIDTITEDTDLGLTMLEQGWVAHYTNRRYGHGLLPDSFEAFKKQRHRWAYGGFHIIKKHWRRFMPGASMLTREQRRDYSLGWVTWLGAETLGVCVAILNLLWVPVVAFAGIAIPDKILTLPILMAFAVMLGHYVTLYRLRVTISGPQMVLSSIAAMSLQWTVAKAMFDGLVKDHMPFARTAKGGRGQKAAFQGFWEAVLGGLLLVGAVVLVATNRSNIREINIFAVVLVVQSLPFLSAVAMALLDGSRFNEFAYWASLRASLRPRFADFVTRRPAALVRAPAPAEKQVETVR